MSVSAYTGYLNARHPRKLMGYMSDRLTLFSQKRGTKLSNGHSVCTEQQLDGGCLSFSQKLKRVT